VLAELVARVYTIEIVEPLAQRAEADLQRLGYTNVLVRTATAIKAGPKRRRSTFHSQPARPNQAVPPPTHRTISKGRACPPDHSVGWQSTFGHHETQRCCSSA